MSVIDFHSHVLPRIDDGSHSSEESLGMLQISASQGIDEWRQRPIFMLQKTEFLLF